MPEVPQINIAGKDMVMRRQATGVQATPYDLLACAKTKTIQYVNEFGETTSHDVDTPTAVPWRTSLLVSRSWTLNISGSCDMKRLALLRGDATTATAPTRYQLQFSGVAADGGGSIIGPVWVENLQIQSQNMGVVEFTCQLRGEGAASWVAAT